MMGNRFNQRLQKHFHQDQIENLPNFSAPLTSFRMNTYRCVSKQMTLNPLESALTQKREEGVSPVLPKKLAQESFQGFQICRPRLFRAGKVNCLNAQCFHFTAKDI